MHPNQPQAVTKAYTLADVTGALPFAGAIPAGLTAKDAHAVLALALQGVIEVRCGEPDAAALRIDLGNGRVLLCHAEGTAAVQTPAPALHSYPPRIGQLWPEQGGVYAGLVRGADGGPDQHLILSAALLEKRLKWKAACTWAAELEDAGFSDWTLPTRDEGALLYANVRHLVEGGWHWLIEQYSAGDAWTQHFNGGLQGSNAKSYEARARAVRRFAAQSFNPSEGVAPAAAAPEAVAA